MFFAHVLVLLCSLLFVHSASPTLAIGTFVIGSGNPIDNPVPTFDSSKIISSISVTLDAYGITSISVCTRTLVSLGDGAVYATPSDESCILHGTVTGQVFVDKFTADEWPAGISFCSSNTNMLVVGLNITTSENNYWIVGNFTNCAKTTLSSVISPVAIYGIGSGSRFSPLFTPGIGQLEVAYFYCTGNCRATLYNGGDPCGTRNGGCDLTVACTNVVHEAQCSPCASGFTQDVLGVCRPIRYAAHYDVTNDLFPLNNHANGSSYTSLPAFMPPYKISAINGLWEDDYYSTVLMGFALIYKQVNLGKYVDETIQINGVNGWDASAHPVIYNETIELPENEWITSFTTRVILWDMFYAIGAINFTTNLRTFSMNGNNSDSLIDFQHVDLKGQILVTFNGTSGQYLDNVQFIGANCSSGACPLDPYGSGICATISNDTCVGSYCQDTSDNFVCTCYPGYILFNQTLCTPPIDHYCESGFCDALVSCTTNAGPIGYECGNCPQGYSGSGYTQCQDIDECVTYPGICGTQKCYNIPGNFSCNSCPTGYTLTDGDCQDVDECAQHKCGDNRYCNNTPGNYTCGDCFSGYQLINNNCTDIDECSNATLNTCTAQNKTCNNTQGNFVCGTCLTGFQNSSGNCFDINECSNATLNTCATLNRTCSNTPGDFLCGGCVLGFQVSNTGECIDVDECSNSTMNNCAAENKTCNNTQGSFECGNCLTGFQPTDAGNCEEVEPCIKIVCPLYAHCESNNSSINCACNSGFTGNGSSCRDENECIDKEACSPFASCQNTVGSFTCTCNALYQGDGKSCSPLCGDGHCDVKTENCVSCPHDCTETDCSICGDGLCDAPINESCSTCPNDCGVCNPSNCPASCSNHGTCYNGVCTCADSWTGPSCNDKTQPVAVNINKAVNVTLNQLNFQITFNRIVEYNSDMKIVQEIVLSDTNIVFTQNTTMSSVNTQWIYGTLLRNRAILNITIWQFEQIPLTHFDFASSTLSFPPHTVKLTFNIQSWPFMTAQNSLGIELGTSGPLSSPSSPSSCSSKDVNSNADSVSWLTLSYGDVALYGQFLNKAVVDGRVRNITYVSSSNVNITALVPHFWDSVLVDPDFSVLLNPTDPCNHHPKNGISKTTIIAIVIPVVVVVILGALLIIYWPKIATRIKVGKFSKTSDGQDIELNARM